MTIHPGLDHPYYNKEVRKLSEENDRPLRIKTFLQEAAVTVPRSARLTMKTKNCLQDRGYVIGIGKGTMSRSLP